MSTRKVYLDFQDGVGFLDVSHLVKYDTLSITTRAFNDTYHAAQNEASFSVNYDLSIFTKLNTLTKEIVVRIFDMDDDVLLATETYLTLITENSFALAVEQELAIPVFYGHIPVSRSYRYNGILNNITVSLEATDELDLLDVPVGDICIVSGTVANSADPAHSIVHILAAIAGWPSIGVASSLNIPVVLDRFVPTDPEDTVRDVLDTLLYEYGYALNMSGASVITPIKWLYTSGDGALFTFDENNIVREVQLKESVKKYDGAQVIYYDLKTASKVLMYRDENCGYADDGSFEGYTLIGGYTYPPETNVIDETTGLPTVVYQEYTDDSIKYWTNKAIQNNLDYNYKAFSSNFSALVSTENHFVDYRMDAGLTIPTVEFHNTKCRIVYNNPTTNDALKLYYNNVYADVWYKSVERACKVESVLGSTNLNKYTTSYVFSKTYADMLVKAMAAQYLLCRTAYMFPSEDAVQIGALVYITIGTGDNQLCYVQNKDWDERTQQYTYTLLSASIATPELTAQTLSVAVTVNTSYTYGSYSTIGTPEAVEEVVAAVVPTVAPKYLGIAIITSASVPTGTLYYVNGTPAFVSGGTFTANVGDWAFIRGVVGGAGDEIEALRIWTGSVWSGTNITSYHRTTAAQDLMSVCKIYGTPTSGDSYEWFNSLVANQAFIDFLMVNTLKITNVIYGGDRFDATGNVIDSAKSGIFISADGNIKLAGIQFTGSAGGFGGAYYGRGAMRLDGAVTDGKASMCATYGGFFYANQATGDITRYYTNRMPMAYVTTAFMSKGAGVVVRIATSINGSGVLGSSQIFVYDSSSGNIGEYEDTGGQYGVSTSVAGTIDICQGSAPSKCVVLATSTLRMLYNTGTTWQVDSITSGVYTNSSSVTKLSDDYYCVQSGYQTGSSPLYKYSPVLSIYKYTGSSFVLVASEDIGPHQILPVSYSSPYRYAVSSLSSTDILLTGPSSFSIFRFTGTSLGLVSELSQFTGENHSGCVALSGGEVVMQNGTHLYDVAIPSSLERPVYLS